MKLKPIRKTNRRQTQTLLYDPQHRTKKNPVRLYDKTEKEELERALNENGLLEPKPKVQSLSKKPEKDKWVVDLKSESERLSNDPVSRWIVKAEKRRKR